MLADHLCSHVSSSSLPHSLNVYPSNLPLIPSSFLPFMFVSPPCHPPFHSPRLVPTLPICPSLPHTLMPFLCFLGFFVFFFTLTLPSFLTPLAVCDSQERGEECSEHVRSQKIPPGPGEQRGVVVLLLPFCGAESGPQWPVGVPHLPRRPGHPGLSWSGAEQSG